MLRGKAKNKKKGEGGRERTKGRRTQHKSAHRQEERKEGRPERSWNGLCCFSHSLFCLLHQVPAFLNRIQNFAFPSSPLFALFVLQAIFQPLQGFFNALVYVSQERRRDGGGEGEEEEEGA